MKSAVVVMKPLKKRVSIDLDEGIETRCKAEEMRSYECEDWYACLLRILAMGRVFYRKNEK